MTAKEYLLQAFTVNRLLKAYQAQIAELREMQTAVGNTVLGDRVKSSPLVNDRIAEVTVKLLDLTDEYQSNVVRLLNIKSEIKSIIDTAENPTYQLILTERYINLKRWEDVATDNGYSWRTVHRIHSEALKKVGIECHTLDMV